MRTRASLAVAIVAAVIVSCVLLVQEAAKADSTTSHRIVVDEHSVVVVNTLVRCRHADGSGQRAACDWNIKRHKHRSGPAYWIDGQDVRHYVWRHNPGNRYPAWRFMSTDELLWSRLPASTQVIFGAAYEFYRYPDGTRWSTGAMATDDPEYSS